MPEQFRVHDRTVTYLDSAPWIPGVAQHVAPAGLTDAGEGTAARKTVVLIHAFPLNADMWAPQLDAVPAGWRYLAPDLRGFGRSDPDEMDGPAPPSIDDYARDILALLDHLHVNDAVVAGLSMGGYAAFALVRLAPQRVRGLVLANTKAEADSQEARSARAGLLDELSRGGVAAVAGQMLPRLLGQTTRTERAGVQERARAIAEANSVEGLRGALLRMMNRPDSTDLLATIRCPTLVVASSEDVVTPADRTRAMVGRMPDARLVTIQGAGHLSNLEQPGDFNFALTQFLAERFGG